MIEYYDREKLYNEIWKEPMIKVCKRYGVSDVALAKTCKKLRIPRPPVGYWAKKAHGKATTKIKLYKYDDAPRIQIRRTEDKKPEKPKERLAPDAFKKAEKLISEIKVIPAPNEINDIHYYVRNTRKIFKRNSKTRYPSKYNRVSTSSDDCFKVSIGKDSIDRASIILETLCESMIANGFEVVLDDKRNVCFKIMNELLEITIQEHTKEIKITDAQKEPGRYYSNNTDYLPSGVFKFDINCDSFFMEGRSSWTDTKTKKIEYRLLEIIHQLIFAAALKKESVARKKKREEERKIEEAERAEKQRLVRIEEKRVSQLKLDLRNGYTTIK